jgi:hypothetical protein
MTTRVKRDFLLPPDRLTSIRVALADPSWRHAMEEEYDYLIANNTWDLVPRSVGSNIATGKWIFKHKYNSDGTLVTEPPQK